MYSLQNMPSTASVLSAYTTFAASTMLVRTALNEVKSMANQLIPQRLRDKITSRLEGLLGNYSSQLTIIINEYNGFSLNEIYQASEVYLSTKITPSIRQLKVSKDSKDNSISVTVDKGQKIIDIFEGMTLEWEFVSTETQQTVVDYESFSQSAEKKEHKSCWLSFHKQQKDKVLNSYLPYVLDQSKAIRNQDKVVKLHSLGNLAGDYNLDHPSTFETLAMEPHMKQMLKDDLDRFLKRKEFYKRVGKPWKRGYLLYGPPGTGKSSLIAAMANYLKFDIYELELTSLQSNSDLKWSLTRTTNRSIIVIEDIDCSVELKNRQSSEYNSQGNSQLTLSGLLNFIDGLWSSCGDERIIVFTTNYKDRLDPALLRPGRMDLHIHMSYCTPSTFRILVFNYLKIQTHYLFDEIEQMISKVEVTPAEVAEELMRSEDVDIALNGVVGLLQKKQVIEESKSNIEEDHNVKANQDEKDIQENEVEQLNKKRKRARGGRGRGRGSGRKKLIRG